MQTISIGRDPGNQIVLNDNFISRRHAELIVMDNGGVMIKDLGSSNGTFVNGNRITEYYIKSGDIVKCASVFLNWQEYVMSSIPKKEKPFIPDKLSNQAYVQSGQSAQYRQETTQAAFQTAPDPVQNQQATSAQPYVQQNVVVVGKVKSVGVAFLLAFFFGPLGLLYASVIGGIVMFLVDLILIFVFFPGLIITGIICIIWACVAADQANRDMVNRAAPLIQNQYRQ